MSGRLSRVGLWVVLLGLPLAAGAAEPLSYANVSALQPPVWVERHGQRSALAVSATIGSDSRYITGPGARLHIALADGSMVKLGENAEFRLPALQLTQAGGDSVLHGALKVLKGAFRYTTQALGFIRRRELDVAIGPTVTIGIRGTDVWGKSDDAQDLACLIEGSIRVGSPGRPDITMDRPGSFYVVPRGQAPQPVAPVPADKLKTWIPQTELVPDRPALQSNGPYTVVLAVYLDEALARQRLQEFNAKGYPATLRRRDHEGTPVYSLTIEGLSDAQSAAAFGEQLRQILRLRNPRVLPPGA
ncbi:MAG: hypothetical protein E6R07_07610 [Nevskiaceae bacterium]|nr:MAG: hypothetical protein E6R07_07610 [Nevskiaceae bacterium]